MAIILDQRFPQDIAPAQVSGINAFRAKFNQIMSQKIRKAHARQSFHLLGKAFSPSIFRPSTDTLRQAMDFFMPEPLRSQGAALGFQLLNYVCFYHNRFGNELCLPGDVTNDHYIFCFLPLNPDVQDIAKRHDVVIVDWYSLFYFGHVGDDTYSPDL
jgi:hypothetical protein